MNTTAKPVSAAEQVAIDQLDSLLDKNLSDVADLPDYLDEVVKGMYVLKMISVEKKAVEIGDPDDKEGKRKIQAPAIQFVYEIESCLEQANAEETPSKIGGRFNEAIFFHRDAEKATSVIKAKYQDVALAWGIEHVGQLIAKLTADLPRIAAHVNTNADKNKKDKFYIQVKGARLA